MSESDREWLWLLYLLSIVSCGKSDKMIYVNEFYLSKKNIIIKLYITFS